MRDYELMVIVRPDLDEEATKAALDKVRGLITNGGGTIEKEDVWGKRRLAYEIKKNRDGYYAVFNFKGTAEIANEIDRVLKISDEFVRHMTVRPGE